MREGRWGEASGFVLLVPVAFRLSPFAFPKAAGEDRLVELPGRRVGLGVEVAAQRLAQPRVDLGFGKRARQRLEESPAQVEVVRGELEVEERRLGLLELLLIELGDAELRTHHRLIRLLVEAKREPEAAQVLARARQQGAMPVEKQRSMLESVTPLLKSSVVQEFIRQTEPDFFRNRFWGDGMIRVTGRELNDGADACLVEGVS